MPPKSVQHKLSRVRPPRVHITTDVETGAAIEMVELPFVVGVLGDFSGKPKEPLAPVSARKFVEITPDNFDKVLEAMKPRLELNVKNTLTKNDPKAASLKVDLEFQSLEDFEPQRVAENVPALKELLELRSKLSDLKGSLQGNSKFEEMLQQAIQNTERRQQLRDELQKEKDK